MGEVLNRSGLIIGFAGSMLMALDLLDREKLQRVEDFFIRTLQFLLTPRRLLALLLKPSKSLAQHVFIAVYLGGLGFFIAVPVLLGSGVLPDRTARSVGYLLIRVFGFPLLHRWMELLAMLPLWGRIGGTLVAIALGKAIPHCRSRPVRVLLTCAFFAVAICVLPQMLFLALATAGTLVIVTSWTVLLVLLILSLLLLSLPLRTGLILQERFGFRHALTSSGITLLMISFLLQFLATF